MEDIRTLRRVIDKASTKSPFGYSWKLKTEKHCNKIIFKCVNSTVRSIFNEKVVKKWNLWVHKQWNLCWKCEKSQTLQLLFMNSIRNSEWTVKKLAWNAWKKKKKKKTETQTRISAFSAQSKWALRVLALVCVKFSFYFSIKAYFFYLHN